MLFELTLSHPKPGITPAEAAARWQDRLSGLEPLLQGIGWHPLGLYTVEVETRAGSEPARIDWQFSLAEVALIEAGSWEEALFNLGNSGLATAWRDHHLAYLDPTASLTFGISILVPSPLTRQPISLAGRLLRFDLRHLHPEQSLPALVEFEERIESRYTDYLLRAAWYHVGTFLPHGLPDDYYGDGFDVIQARTPKEAQDNDSSLTTPHDVQLIFDECAQFTDRSRDRVIVWLTPLELTTNAASVLFDLQKS